MSSFSDVIMTALEWGAIGAATAAGIAGGIFLLSLVFAFFNQGISATTANLNKAGAASAVKTLLFATALLGGYFFTLGFFIHAGKYFGHPWIGMLLAVFAPLVLVVALWRNK
jgi:hypothetical protein